ncbi:MAG: Crp/Fnr family transcriptional regulator [Nitrospira sp.]|nr:Crp/Fnr family transcriptional regulator [Nitrospira sp.]
MLTTVEKVLLLQGVDIFLETETEHLAKVAVIAQEVRFAPGTIIFREGQPSDALYVVLDGTVSLLKDKLEKTMVKERETFGLWALLDESPRLVTAVAVTEISALKIEREYLYDVLSSHFDIVRGILKCLDRRIRGSLEK